MSSYVVTAYSLRPFAALYFPAIGGHILRASSCVLRLAAGRCAALALALGWGWCLLPPGAWRPVADAR